MFPRDHSGGVSPTDTYNHYNYTSLCWICGQDVLCLSVCVKHSWDVTEHLHRWYSLEKKYLNSTFPKPLVDPPSRIKKD